MADTGTLQFRPQLDARLGQLQVEERQVEEDALLGQLREEDRQVEEDALEGHIGK